jgi:signal transduction histidine kinase
VTFVGRLRAAIPDTLFARIAVILVVNLLVVQAIAFVLIGIETNRLPFDDPDLVGRVSAAVRAIDALPPGDHDRFAHAMSEPGFSVHVSGPHGPNPLFNRPEPPPPDGNGDFRPTPPPPPALESFPPPDGSDGDTRAAGLRMQLKAALASDGRTPDVRVIIEPMGLLPPGEGARWLRIVVSLRNGDWTEFRLHRHPPTIRWTLLLSLVALVCIVVSGMSIIFARNFSRHLSSFAGAAEAFGRSTDAPPLPESGPREIRLATDAFNRMQERLRRFVRDRTQMLAAISHDLRTPLTRLRLRAEFVEDDEIRDKMLMDIAEMQAMLRETLSFARDEDTREPRQAEDLDQLLDDLCTVLLEAGQDVAYTASGPAMIQCSPIAIRRAFANLLDNAVKYGSCARVTLQRSANQITIDIDDDGPGIPGPMQERVFQPFFRLESSRNRDTGGVGLGMSVARTIVRGHGGDVTLANRGQGGLRVTVTLPA